MYLDLNIRASPCAGPSFVRQLTGIRHSVVQIQGMKKDDLLRKTPPSHPQARTRTIPLVRKSAQPAPTRPQSGTKAPFEFPLNLCVSTLESGKLWYKSQASKKTICANKHPRRAPRRVHK